MTATFELNLIPRECAATIKDRIAEAIRIARLLNVVVSFTFKEVTIWAYPNSDPKRLLKYWEEAKNQEKKPPL